MDASDQIVTQLRWIKWLTALLALSFATIAVLLAWTTHEMSSVLKVESSSFSDRASKLLDEGKELEVLKLSDDLEKKVPKDPNVFWYRGRAHYQLGQFREALLAMQRVEELAPNWRQEYTAPYRKAIEEKLGEKR
jgi:cytochrome c-type biogenesis protein CcmH/NrfG